MPAFSQFAVPVSGARLALHLRRAGLTLLIIVLVVLVLGVQEALARPLTPQAVGTGGLPWWLFVLGAAAAAVALFFVLRSGRRQKSRARLYEAIFEHSTQPIILTDLELKVVDANPEACRLLGQTRVNARFQHFVGLVEVEAAFALTPLLTDLERTGSARFEARIQRKGGERRDLEVTLNRIDGATGERLLLVLNDVTESHRQLEQFEELYGRLLEDIPIEVLVLSPEGRYEYVGPQIAPSDEVREWLIGKTDFEYCQEMGLHMEIALRRRSYRKQAIDTKQTVQFEEALPARGGGERLFTRIYSPVIREDGSVWMVACYGLERTQVHAFETQLKTAREEAEEASRMKESFLRNISHEFRTPLTGIIGFSQILAEEVNEPLREFVDSIEANGHRLLTTLDTLLDLAGLEAENVIMRPQVLDVVVELEGVLHLLRDSAEAKGLFLRQKITSPECLVRLDATSLQRVLFSVVENAIKFTQRGGVVVEVSSDDANVHVSVMDTGIGIEHEKLPRIFNDFNQVESGIDRSFEGLGVGLSVTKRLVRLLNGQISVHSERGEGTMFRISFPTAFPMPEGGAEARTHVLIVDGSREMHRMAEYMLGNYFNVDKAPNLKAGLDLLRSRGSDVVLLDVHIEHELAPAQLLEKIRRIPGCEKLPVIAVDARALPGGHLDFLTSGFDHYLTKPFKKLNLMNAIDGVFLRGGTREMHAHA